MKTIIEAKVAAKFVFDVIDRKPEILINDPSADKHKLLG